MNTRNAAGCPFATAVIRYTTPSGAGKEMRAVCSAAKDDADTLRRLLERWRPRATFVSARIVTTDGEGVASCQK